MSIFKEDISIYINIYTMYHKNTHFYSNFIWVGVVREIIHNENESCPPNTGKINDTLKH